MTTQVVSCTGCSSRLKAKPEYAGKTLKCPKCGQPITVPAVAPAAAEDDWIDITEAYVRPEAKGEPAAARSAAAPTKGWGEELLEEQEVPDDMREQIREALTKGEKITWAGRPLLNVLMHRAGRQRIVGIAVICGFTIAAPTLAFFMFRIGQGGTIAIGCFALFFMLVFDALGVFLIGSPGRTQRDASKRACYMLTNRRLVIHPGMGSQVATSRGGAHTNVTVGGDVGGVTSYSGVELLALRRNEDKAFPGTGELILGRDLLDEPAGGQLVAMDDLVGLEKRIREQLIHPVIDKLLRGEVSVKEGFGRQKEKPTAGQGEVLPTEGNLKDYAKDELPTEGNVKAQKSPLEESLKAVGKELRKKVEAELTEGERLLWVGQPEGKTKGRGVLGALSGAAERVEPEYHLYALTTRRAILWDKKGTKEARFAFGNEERGPITYYPTQLLDAELEDDKRISEGGSIIFKRVKRVIITRNKQGKDSKRTELHHFGILRVRNYSVLARALYNTLIRPVRRG